jgi:acyl carrier protein
MRCGYNNMTDIESRVSNCFLNVFPDMGTADVPRATQAAIAQWDSVAHVTLLSAVAEEFQIELDDDSFESLVSYPVIVRFVESRLERH